MPSPLHHGTVLAVPSSLNQPHPAHPAKVGRAQRGLLTVGGGVQGVIVYFRVMDGELKVGDTIKLMNTGKEYQVDEVGVLAPKPVQARALLPPTSVFSSYHRLPCTHRGRHRPGSGIGHESLGHGLSLRNMGGQRLSEGSMVQCHFSILITEDRDLKMDLALPRHRLIQGGGDLIKLGLYGGTSWLRRDGRDLKMGLVHGRRYAGR